VIVKIEALYGSAGRIWVMDRGMVSKDNIEFLKEGGRRYILGTPRSQLKGFAKQLAEKDWQQVREGLQVKLCPSPDGTETYILCRSAQRLEKEKAMHERFEKRIEAGLQALAESCDKRAQSKGAVERRVGRLLGRNSRAAALFDVAVKDKEDGRAEITFSRVETWRGWADLSEGCYMLRSNVTDWSAEALWQAYTQLSEAEAAFRIHKTDLSIRPIWHQKQERVQAHILVCFLAYVLWKTLGQLCRAAGLGNAERKVLDELAQLKMVDVVLPTKGGPEIRKRCVARPDAHQAILLQRLGLAIPKSMRIANL